MQPDKSFGKINKLKVTILNYEAQWREVHSHHCTAVTGNHWFLGLFFLPIKPSSSDHRALSPPVPQPPFSSLSHEFDISRSLRQVGSHSICPVTGLFHSVQCVASLVAQMVKNLPAMQETQVWSLGQEDPLEKEMATHSSILAWKIPWTEEPRGLQSMGLQRVSHGWATNTLTW